MHDEAKVKGPGVVTGRYGTLGEVFYVEHDYWPLNTTLYVQDFKGNHRRFISYFLQTLGFASQNAAGAVPGVNRNHLHKLDVKVPGVPTQRKIASILSAYDDLTENNTRRIAIAEEMAQAIYREWFVNFRFPGHENVKLVDSPLGQIPEGWEVATLETVLEFFIGGGWGKAAEEEGFTEIGAVIRGTDIPNAKHMNVLSCPVRFHKQSNIRSRRVQDGDIVFEVSGGSKGQPVGRSLFVSDRLLACFEDDVICASFCKLIRPNGEKLRSSLFFHYLLESYTNGVIEQYEVQSTGIKNFKFTEFLAREHIAVPPSVIQDEFDTQFHTIQSQIEVLGRKTANLRTTRDLLLPKLISGKLDVEDLDIDVGLAADALEEATA
ncbi:Type I restriction modification DNA specificity domain protein [Allorhodopirellula solitaria]|uniref:Type I restriction modification DNA specificity domain protein n=2 Tax=Allorhodopirellula solitaria TaxID=2527987 RepID=A0A5C5YE83_9BACT|nr:Type I restriction modification DNA specificity domain protein [Allorhodopirellula solitaria]